MGVTGETRQPKPALRRTLGVASLVLATAVWLPLVHLFFAEPPAQHFANSPAGEHSSFAGIPPKARELAARHLELWTDPAQRAHELEKMRASNAEWDFMGRSFLVWSLADMAARDPATKAQSLQVIDTIIDETLHLERERGLYFFLMPYAHDKAFVARPARSQFLDGEIALMLAMRRLVEEKPEYRPLLSERVEAMVARMEQSPVLSAESYPNECWTFCNAIALAAIRAADRLDGTDHADLVRRWVETAKAKLVDPASGLLVSAYTLQGQPLYGPEGSSIWVASHFLRFADRDFAADQYARARKELGRELLGFGYAREWPASWEGPANVDSGFVVPVLGASAGSSGTAFVAAASFGDTDYLDHLWTAVDFGGLPIRRHGTLRYAASNQVGDAVMLYSMTLGPLEQQVIEGRGKP